MEDKKYKVYLYGETGMLSTYSGPINLIEIWDKETKKHSRGSINQSIWEEDNPYETKNLTPDILRYIALGYQIIFDKTPKMENIPLKEEYKKTLKNMLKRAIDLKQCCAGNEGLENIKNFEKNLD